MPPLSAETSSKNCEDEHFIKMFRRADSPRLFPFPKTKPEDIEHIQEGVWENFKTGMKISEP
jgi:hypothetical protein